METGKGRRLEGSGGETGGQTSTYTLGFNRDALETCVGVGSTGWDGLSVEVLHAGGGPRIKAGAAVRDASVSDFASHGWTCHLPILPNTGDIYTVTKCFTSVLVQDDQKVVLWG